MLSIGPLTVHWYGLFFGLGFLIGTQLVIRMFMREGLRTNKIDALLLYMMFGTLIGARLGHTLIYEPEIYLHDPIRILKIWEGGLASHGGAVGVIFAIWLWKRKYWSRSFLELLDFLTIPGTLTGCLIRIGNFFNSEIIGRPTDVPWAITFKKIDNLPRHP